MFESDIVRVKKTRTIYPVGLLYYLCVFFKFIIMTNVFSPRANNVYECRYNEYTEMVMKQKRYSYRCHYT